MKIIAIAVLVTLMLSGFEKTTFAENGGFCRNVNPNAQVCR